VPEAYSIQSNLGLSRVSVGREVHIPDDDRAIENIKQSALKACKMLSPGTDSAIS